MRELDYGTSPAKPWIVRAERVLAYLGGELPRNWRGLVAILIANLVLLAAIALVLYQITHAPRILGELAGPTGVAREYQLTYARNGNLTLETSRGERIAMVRDYYGDTSIAQVDWPTMDQVTFHMRDGTTIEMDTRGGAQIYPPERKKD